ncbi:MAG: methyltransferase domain-containing protein, partial [Actinobacteria bacterium]|nr:methyltransferase domain-containing protein [Actinomycetota bacterium]
MTFVHAAAENTGLADASADLVSLCLVCHELPQLATLDIFREAYRLLRPGGILSVCDMNPS